MTQRQNNVCLCVWMFLRKWGAKMDGFEDILVSQKNRDKLCKIADMMSQDERMHFAISVIYFFMCSNNAGELQFVAANNKELITIKRQPMEE